MRAAALADALRVPAREVHPGLEALQSQNAIEILSGPPFYVVALRASSWPGKSKKPAENPTKTGHRVNRAYSFQSSLSQSKQLKESYRRPAEDDALLREVLDTLGETDPTTFRGALRSYSPEIIRTALQRIRTMPRIRKNPTALFRFLLPRIAQEPRFKN
jgi:hypothetical protein